MFSNPDQREVVALLDAAIAMLGASEGASARELEGEADRLLDRTVAWMRQEPTAPEIATALEGARAIHRQAISLVERPRG